MHDQETVAHAALPDTIRYNRGV